MVLPLLALISGGEYNCEEVLDQLIYFKGLTLSIHLFHHHCLFVSLLRANEGLVGLGEMGEMGGYFQVCSGVPGLSHTHTHTHTHTHGALGGCFLLFFFFFLSE